MFSSYTTRKVLSLLALIFIWALMAHMSWLRWPDLIVDFGREIYTPWQLSNGAALYKDIAYFNGPVSPYLNSILMRVFGESLLAIEVFNILLTAAIAYFIYRFFENKTEGGLAAFAASAIFLSVFAFGKYFPMGSYNFIAPYSHEMVHGTFLSVFALYMLKLYADERRPLWMALAGAGAGLVIMTKPEIAAALNVAVFLGFFMTMRLERQHSRISGAVAYGIGLILPVLAFVIFLSFYLGFIEAVKGVFSPWIILATTDVSSTKFYKTLSGLDNIPVNLRTVLLYAASWALVLIIPLAANYLLRKKPIAAKYGGAASFVITAAVFAYFFDRVQWLLILRPLPLFAGCAALFFAVMYFRKTGKEEAGRFVPLFAFSIFSFLMLLKIILNVQVNGYGFVLALPAAMLAVYMLLSYLPSSLKKAWGHGSIFCYSALAILIVMCAWHLKLTKGYYDTMTYEVGSGPDTIRTFDPAYIGVGKGMNVLLENIERVMAPGDDFVMMPEGALINYLSRRKNPTGFINFVPADVTMFGEDRMVAALESKPPKYVIMISRDTSEYGVHYLGQDYGFKLFSFVANRYEKVLRIGNEDFLTRSAGFSQPLGMVIFKRVDK